MKTTSCIAPNSVSLRVRVRMTKSWYLAGAFCLGRNDDKKDWNKAIEDYKFIDENLLPGLLKQAVHLQIAEA